MLRVSLFGGDPVCRCIVAEDGHAVMGYAISFATFSTFRAQRGLWLEDIYVTPSHRGRGIGKAMLEYLIAEGRRLGLGRIEWSVLDWNQSAIDFYERLGARVMPDWRICRVSIDP